MKFSKVAVVASAATVPVSAEDCIYSLQVLQLQDASASFQDDVMSMEAVAGQLIGNITTKYPGSKYGLASFIDKPVVGHGYGSYGGFQEYTPDYCFKSHLDFTTDVPALQSALSALASTVGSGFDNQENQFEALLYAAQDPSVSWAPPDQTHDEATGRPLVRLVIMITDAPPHLEGDYAANTLNNWDWPRSYSPNTIDGVSIGGFGADAYQQNFSLINAHKTDDYNELAALFHKVDFGVDFTADEQSRYDTLMTELGPYPWPDFVTPHPGTIGQDCAFVEYPSVETVGYFLRAHNIFPVFLVANPVNDAYTASACPKLGYDGYDAAQLKECIVTMYKNYLGDFQTTGYVGTLDDGSADIVSVVMAAISDVVDDVCVGSTPAPVPLPSTPAPFVTGSTNSGTDSTDTTTGAAGGGGAAPASGGANTAVIAAAGAGAAAAVAAAGIFAYKKWGAGAFAKTPGGDAAAIGEVDVPETQIERETVEEVTMDMFQ